MAIITILTLATSEAMGDKAVHFDTTVMAGVLFEE